jgi:hypothetical protein
VAAGEVSEGKTEEVVVERRAPAGELTFGSGNLPRGLSSIAQLSSPASVQRSEMRAASACLCPQFHSGPSSDFLLRASVQGRDRG